MSDCIFCKIVRKEIPAPLLAENEGSIAIADIHPQAPFHALVIPKEHFKSLNELQAKRSVVLESAFALVENLAEKKGFKDKGFRTVINTGKDGGQTVFHLHIHVLAETILSEKF